MKGKIKFNSKHLIFYLFFCFLFNIQNLNSQLLEGRRITKELCSEKYFGRGYIKSGDSLAAEFIASEFQKRGLKQIDNSYFQSFSFEVNTFPNEMLLVIDDKKLIPGIDFIVDPSSGSSDVDWNYKFFNKDNIFNEKDNLELIREIRDKRTWNSIIFDTRFITGDSLKKLKVFIKEMANYCHVISITDEKFTFSVSETQFKFSYLYLKSEAFYHSENKNIDVLKKITTRIDAKIKKKHEARNVIACLPAKKKSKKYIFLTAHYDHLGGMGTSTFFPGANDNASGTSILFALADELKSKRQKYNLVFIAFAGEEAGLKGSKHYTENPIIPLKKIEFVLNLDIMGSGEEGITVVNATEFPILFDKLNKVNKQHLFLNSIKKRGKAANSDHYWFSENQVPAFFIYTMGPNKNYHDVYDTYENLSFNEYEDLVKLILEFIKKL
jgi:aminopeptidase YwaD